MTEEITAGGRFDVAFSFYEGPAGVSPVDGGEAIVAIRLRSVRGAYEAAGTVDGRPVEIVRIEKSPVAGYTRVVVRLVETPGD